MNTGPSPSISVVMPVHDRGAHLDAAIGSIVGQTWQDFEFVILDDASTDDTPGILERWAARDPRIRLARSPAREGWGGRAGRARTRALYYATACTVWAGDRPGVAPLRSLAQIGLLTPGALEIGLLAGSALGSPTAVRAAMGLTIRVCDHLAGWLLGPRTTVDWRPR
jgi:glycosyltransferase involved in cell wall biosynthesis